MDLNKMVNDSLSKIETEGYVETVIEEKVKGTIQKIVSDLFSPYGDFGKNLKEEIQAKLHINLKKLDLCSYNVMLINAVNEHFRRTISEQGIEKLKEQMNRLLCDAKSEYKLSELVQEMKECAMDNSNNYWGQEISFYHSSMHDVLIFIRFDPEEYVEEYRCKYKLTVNRDGTVNSIGIGGHEFNNGLIMGGLYGLDETLFKIYASGAKVIVDVENVSLQYDEREEGI